jgi:hypothetical protein
VYEKSDLRIINEIKEDISKHLNEFKESSRREPNEIKKIMKEIKKNSINT